MSAVVEGLKNYLVTDSARQIFSLAEYESRYAVNEIFAKSVVSPLFWGSTAGAFFGAVSLVGNQSLTNAGAIAGTAAIGAAVLDKVFEEFFSLHRSTPNVFLVGPAIGTALATLFANAANNLAYKAAGIGFPPESFPIAATALATGAVAFAPAIVTTGALIAKSTGLHRLFRPKEQAPTP